MEIEKLLYRFLKDNGIYPVIRDQIRQSNLMCNRRPNSLISERVLCNLFQQHGIKGLFYEIFKYNRIFSGDHRSANRRYFYKLNKKWKNFVDGKCFLQHNIKIGDSVEFYDGWYIKRTGTVIKIDEKLNLFRIRESRYGYEAWRTILHIDSAINKEAIINLYYKDENGLENGKIDGNYTEIQLQ